MTIHCTTKNFGIDPELLELFETVTAVQFLNHVFVIGTAVICISSLCTSLCLCSRYIDIFMIEDYICRPRLTWCDVFRGYGDLSVHRY